MKKLILLGLLLVPAYLYAEEIKEMPKKESVSFGAGCFWCVEATFERLDGVLNVESGYQGGKTENPNYKEVCAGTTGHAEVVKVTYDPAKLPFEQLVDWFFKMHDPTTLNRQGADVGSQYRSAIYYTNDQQKQIAEKVKAKVDASGKYENPIVTEIAPAELFYRAEDYHQDYFDNNPYAGYSLYIRSKLKKLGQKP